MRSLPSSVQSELYSLLELVVYEDGEYIVKQGDIGNTLYVLTHGAASVVEDSGGSENEAPERKNLVQLNDGHCFGEMALVNDERRVASVIAKGRVSCLQLTKASITTLSALSAEKLTAVLEDMASKRAIMREKREQKRQAQLAAVANLSRRSSVASTDSEATMSSAQSRPRSLSRRSTGSSIQSRNSYSLLDTDGVSDVCIDTYKLIKKKLMTGEKVINKYIIKRELGRGSYGYVYLCQSEEDGQLYAMKTISKSTRKWNMNLTDDIKNEIAVMKSLRHQNVVSLLEVIDDPAAKQIYLVQVRQPLKYESAVLLASLVSLMVVLWTGIRTYSLSIYFCHL